MNYLYQVTDFCLIAWRSSTSNERFRWFVAIEIISMFVARLTIFTPYLWKNNLPTYGKVDTKYFMLCHRTKTHLCGLYFGKSILTLLNKDCALGNQRVTCYVGCWILCTYNPIEKIVNKLFSSLIVLFHHYKHIYGPSRQLKSLLFKFLEIISNVSCIRIDIDSSLG